MEIRLGVLHILIIKYMLVSPREKGPILGHFPHPN